MYGWRPSLPTGLRGQRGALKSAHASLRSQSTSCCSSSRETRSPWRRRVDLASASLIFKTLRNRPPSPAVAAGDGKAAAMPPPAAAAPAASATAPNFRQRRSALRSAECHATRRGPAMHPLNVELTLRDAVAPYMYCQRHARSNRQSCKQLK